MEDVPTTETRKSPLDSFHGDGMHSELFLLSANPDLYRQAQDELGAKHNVPVIDVLGAYRRALAKAWKKDRLYEFTPDVIHPTQPGHAAMATEK